MIVQIQFEYNTHLQSMSTIATMIVGKNWWYKHNQMNELVPNGFFGLIPENWFLSNIMDGDEQDRVTLVNCSHLKHGITAPMIVNAYIPHTIQPRDCLAFDTLKNCNYIQAVTLSREDGINGRVFVLDDDNSPIQGVTEYLPDVDIDLNHKYELKLKIRPTIVGPLRTRNDRSQSRTVRSQSSNVSKLLSIAKERHMKCDDNNNNNNNENDEFSMFDTSFLREEEDRKNIEAAHEFLRKPIGGGEVTTSKKSESPIEEPLIEAVKVDAAFIDYWSKRNPKWTDMSEEMWFELAGCGVIPPDGTLFMDFDPDHHKYFGKGYAHRFDAPQTAEFRQAHNEYYKKLCQHKNKAVAFGQQGMCVCGLVLCIVFVYCVCVLC